MRRLISLVIALAFFLTPLSVQAETLAAAEKNVSLSLLSQLYVGQNTLVFSPFSLSVALSMAAEGASGATRSQLDSFLGSKRPKGMILEDLRFSGAELANTALIRSDFSLTDAYQNDLLSAYDAEPLVMIDGSVMNQVNEWVSEHTDGLIEHFLSEEPDSETKLLLINALSLKAEWASPFPASSTGFAVFHAPDGDIEVSSMRQTSSFLYGEADGVQSVVLPYRDSDLEMIVLLPEDGNLQAMVDQLSASPDEFLSRHLPSEEALVRLSLPNVQAESSFELKDALIESGITDAFDPDLADFSAMSELAPSLDLHIGSVLQKAVLKVNETGTEAAAATQVVMLARGAMVETTVEMIVDRPFMMLIHDPISGYVLFAACINNPA